MSRRGTGRGTAGRTVAAAQPRRLPRKFSTEMALTLVKGRIMCAPGESARSQDAARRVRKTVVRDRRAASVGAAFGPISQSLTSIWRALCELSPPAAARMRSRSSSASSVLQGMREVNGAAQRGHREGDGPLQGQMLHPGQRHVPEALHSLRRQLRCGSVVGVRSSNGESPRTTSLSST